MSLKNVMIGEFQQYQPGGSDTIFDRHLPVRVSSMDDNEIELHFTGGSPPRDVYLRLNQADLLAVLTNSEPQP